MGFSYKYRYASRGQATSGAIEAIWFFPRRELHEVGQAGQRADVPNLASMHIQIKKPLQKPYEAQVVEGWILAEGQLFKLR
ncbi:MAG: hypothetical protein KatS3mg026_0955 [Bacteroidia bacterium]|nr:MAG: hypothetical protein KatS3mg026_0955 [Bacteroidia bacterium]